MERLAWALALLLLACHGGDSPAGVAPASVRDWTGDDRIKALIEDCSSLGTFSGDTSYLLGVQVSKLERGSMTVLNNTREELAQAGSRALPELERLVRRLFTARHGSHAVINALGVLEMSEAGGDPRAVALAGDCLGHPQETVRSAAIEVLARHATSVVFDDLLSLMPVVTGSGRGILVSALGRADPRRFELLFLDWIMQESYTGQWSLAARLVAGNKTDSSAALFAPVALSLGDPLTRPTLLAILVDDSDSEAAGLLGEMLADPDPEVRGQALRALEFTELRGLAAVLLRADPVANLRALAAELLGARALDPLANKALHDGLNDSVDAVRQACLRPLVAVGDGAALDLVLSLLAGSEQDIQLAVRCLKGQWEANPSLAPRALEVLQKRLDAEHALPWQASARTYQAMGLIPGPESTALLLAAAAEPGLPYQGLTRHRWLTIQASNSGPRGRALLAQAWRDEDDLQLRLDYLWAASGVQDAVSFGLLKEVLAVARSAPHERLFVADRMACRGPAAEVAGLVKRAARRETDAVYRAALNCLLWRWYGQS